MLQGLWVPSFLAKAQSMQRAGAAEVAAAQATLDNAKLNLGWTTVASPISGIAGIAKVGVGDLMTPNTVMATVSAVDPIYVDFSAMALAAEEAGLDLLAYLNQTAFLLAAGIGELLLRTPPEDAARYLPQANAVQKLLSPAEMGELFKVLIVGKNVDLPEAIERADQSHRL